MLSKEELLNEFFIKDKNNRFNESKFRSLNDKDIRKISLINFYEDSSSLKETYTRIKNNWDNVPNCPVCGKQLKWINSKNRFQHHCSLSCAQKDINVRKKHEDTCLKKYGNLTGFNILKFKQTCLEKYGVESPLLCPEIINKSKQTKFTKYGSETYNNSSKTTQTCVNKYGNGRNNELAKQTMLNKYGVTSYLSSDYINTIRNCKSIQYKIYLSKKNNNTFNTSKPENETYTLLKEQYSDTIYQYKDKYRYPFVCDFYIPSLELFIECNYHWTHGGKPYEGTKMDKEKVEQWKQKNTKYYDNAIITWTIRDVNKRNIAKENKLNYIEFWNIEEVKKWINY